MSLLDGSSKSALIIAHPGHELRVLGWLHSAPRVVHVLTDGSGRQGTPRLASTHRVLSDAQAVIGDIFGHVTDRQLYSHFLQGDVNALRQVTQSLADSLIDDAIEFIVADASGEGFLAHDVFRMIVHCAVRVAEDHLNRKIPVYDFLVDGSPQDCGTCSKAQTLWLHLGDQELQSKIDSAFAYPEVRPFVNEALERFGKEAFRTECLRPADQSLDLTRFDLATSYEQHGAQLVQTGEYSTVIRFDQHVLPTFEQLYTQLGFEYAFPAVA